MEGLSARTILGVLAFYALSGVSFLLLMVSGGLRISGRKPLALKVFAAAVLALAIGCACYPLALTGGGSDWWRLMVVFSVALALAGIGQSLAAFRHPRSYLASFLCSIASAGFIARPLVNYDFNTLLRASIIGGCSLLLGVASLTIAIRRPERPRTRIQLILVTVLFNLVAFLLSLVNLKTENTIVYTDYAGKFVLKDQIADLVGNTHWRWVFAITIGSILFSAAVAVFRPKRTRQPGKGVRNH